jgi:hypothetical protein
LVVITALAQADSVPRKGEFETSFEHHTLLSAPAVQRTRFGLASSPGNAYELAAEHFLVFVPDAYDATPGWGLLVWSHPGNGGEIPRDWAEMLARKKLIWVAARNAGNRRAVGARVGLALDAVHNLQQIYTIEEKRIYIGGVSGGAKVATMAAIGYPDVFDGAICCVGVNWYKDIPVPGKPNTAWPATFRKPPKNVFIDARDHVGFVLITGDKDGNREPMLAMYEQGFVADKFKHAIFHDVPGLAHGPPPVEWLERAIDELDAIPKERQKKPHSPIREIAATRPTTRPSPRR